jgi:hypothetical protein
MTKKKAKAVKPVVETNEMELRYYEISKVQLPDGTMGERVFGYVYNSPKFLDGTFVRTSNIIKREGDLVVTFTGSVYQLIESEQKVTTIVVDDAEDSVDDAEEIVQEGYGKM